MPSADMKQVLSVQLTSGSEVSVVNWPLASVHAHTLVPPYSKPSAVAGSNSNAFPPAGVSVTARAKLKSDEENPLAMDNHWPLLKRVMKLSKAQKSSPSTAQRL